MDLVSHTANSPDYLRWYYLAKLAHRLGFASPQITDALQTGPATKIAESLCAYVIPHMGAQMSELGEVGIQRLTETVTEILADLDKTTDEASTPYITVPGDGVPLLKRCGISPDDFSDIAGCKQFVFGKVHAPNIKMAAAASALFLLKGVGTCLFWPRQPSQT
jgi:hypothetical protein